MFHIILLTTGENEVREKIKSLPCFTSIIDCSNEKSFVFDTLKTYTQQNCEIILTYRCPFILPKEIFTKASLGAYNIHPSLLPKHAGLNPWKDIMNDISQVNGVTIHEISETVDMGKIIIQQPYSIAGMTYNEARERADVIASRLLIDFFDYLGGKVCF